MLIVTKNVPREFAHNFPGRTKAAANLRNNETSRVYKGGGKCRFGLSKKEKRKKKGNGSCLRGRVCAADFFGLPSSTTNGHLASAGILYVEA